MRNPNVLRVRRFDIATKRETVPIFGVRLNEGFSILMPNEKVEAIKSLQEISMFQKFQASSSQERLYGMHARPAIHVAIDQPRNGIIKLHHRRRRHEGNVVNAAQRSNFQDNRVELTLFILISCIVAHWNLRNPQYFWSACFVLMFTGVALERNSEAAFTRRIGLKPASQSAFDVVSTFVLDVRKSTGGLLAILHVACIFRVPPSSARGMQHLQQFVFFPTNS